MHLALDLAHHRRDLFDLFLRRPPAAVDHAKSHGASRFRFYGAFDEFPFGQKWIFVDERVGDRRLRAIMAILGAETAFGIHERVGLHALAEIMMTYFECQKRSLPRGLPL